jgi:hypothetical protein
MTLLASVASLFCSLSLHAAAPSVAVVPEETVNKVEIISPVVETDAAIDSESLGLADAGELGDVADVTNEAAEFGSDKAVADSSDELLLPADVVADDQPLLPADVFVDDESLLPADVFVDGEDLLPADVIADIDADNDAAAAADAEGLAFAETAANTAPLFDEDPAEDAPATPPPSEEPVGKDDGSASGDGEAAS